MKEQGLNRPAEGAGFQQTYIEVEASRQVDRKSNQDRVTEGAGSKQVHRKNRVCLGLQTEGAESSQVYRRSRDLLSL
jgi:hypothetical protein